MATPEDFRDEYGELIWEAINAFSQDPRYLLDMVTAANQRDQLRARTTVAWRRRRKLLAAQTLIDASQPYS